MTQLHSNPIFLCQALEHANGTLYLADHYGLFKKNPTALDS